MTSQINYSSINSSYPVAGQDNSSQGFRDNFGAIQNNFQTAYNEISALQGNVVLLNSVNNLNSNTVIANGKFLSSQISAYDLGSQSGLVNVDFSKGAYQRINLTGSTTISGFLNWPASGTQVVMRLEVLVTNLAYSLTLPAAVTLNLGSLANTSGSTISFTDSGVYIFEFSSLDGGTNISVQDLNRNLGLIQGNLFLETVIGGNTVPGIIMTMSNVAGSLVSNIYATNFIGTVTGLSTSSLSINGNVTANNFIANSSIYGNILTPIQSGITLVGTLSSLAVSANANVGNITVTGMTDMCGGTQYGLQYVSATNSSSITLLSNVAIAIIDPVSSTISAYTITMPTTPVNGQTIQLAFGNTITTLTHTVTGGQTLLGALSTAANTSGGKWVYVSAKSTWFRL